MDVAQGLGEPRYIGLFFVCSDVFSVVYLDLLILCFISCTMNDFDHMMVNKLLNE